MRKTKEIPDVIDNLRRIVETVKQHSRTVEQKTGLTGPQLWALKILAESAPLRLCELASRMYLRPATTVGIIDRLEGRGLVTRVRSREDRRAVDIALTETGKDVLAKAPEVTQIMLLQGLDQLTVDEFAHVAVGMQLMARILGAENVKPQPLHG